MNATQNIPDDAHVWPLATTAAHAISSGRQRETQRELMGEILPAVEWDRPLARQLANELIQVANPYRRGDP